MVPSCRKLLCLSAGKNSTSLSCFNGDIAKICKLILGTLSMPGYTYVGEIPITILAFIIDYFQEKLTSQNLFFKKFQNPYFGSILGPFTQIGAKNEFSWEKKALSVFQYSNYLPLCQKSEKPNEPFLRKLLEGHTKNQFISLISLWDTANFRVLRLIEKPCNLIG